MGRKSSQEITKPKKDFKQKLANQTESGPAKRTRSASKDKIDIDNIEKASTKKKKFFKEGVLNDQSEVVDQEVYPNKLEDYISNKKTIEILREKGIKYLFPIQEKTYKPIFDGKDLIGKDRTGSGKTLAFGIPLVERLRAQKLIQSGKNTKGQKPYGLVILPTRELAIQVWREIQSLSHSNNEFRVEIVYGGADIYEQISKLNNGVELLIGTPGRIMDLYNRGKLSFEEIRALILDEADEMLNLGFVEDIQQIFQFIQKDTNGRKTQNIFFSATIPSWMHDISKQYQTPDREFVDLIRETGMKTSTTVQHYAINCPFTQISETIGDVILCYGGGTKSRCIIFCETKKEANEILLKGKIKQDIQVLHGDIPQKQREITFQAFKEGKIQCLVATNVCARGLDIPEIDLVIQCEPPKDIESYIHRSGRTARAGRKGACITFYNKKHYGLIERIEAKANIKMKRVGVPQPDEILMGSARDIATSLRDVNQEALTLFQDVAHELIEELGAEAALSRAIAFIAGVTEKIKSRSLLGALENYKTYVINTTQEFQALGYVWSFFRNQFDPNLVNSIKGMQKLNGNKGAIFDVPEEFCFALDQYIKDKKEGKISFGHDLEVPTSLPDVNEERSNGSTGNLVFGSFKERQDAKRNKKQLEIFIGGLPFSANEQQVNDFFKQRGVVFLELRLLYGDDNQCKGLGFGLCKNKDGVSKALRCDGQMFQNRKLRINMAGSKPGGR